MESGHSLCKACQLPNAPHSFEEIEAMMEQSPVFRKEKLAADPVYIARVQACLSCPALLDGTTCQWCGCLVPMRAKLDRNDCPNPSGSRWME